MLKRWGLLAAILLLAPATAAQPQHWSDGDVRIVMANTGLLPQDDGAVHLGGDVLGQALLFGNDSGEVAELGFSFGTGPPPPQHSPVHPGLQDFRTDDTPEDGWILPITASDTPPGEYNYAIHAYTEAGNPSSEIARLWGPAVLEETDITPPWPWILPGETAQMTNPYGVQGVTLEFVENATADLWVDGRQVELSAWIPPERDDDNVPRQTVEEEKRVLGSGYQWQGSVQRGTTLRVQATDAEDNEITKAVLVGAPGGGPIVEVSPNPLSEERSTGQGETSHAGLTTTVTNWGRAPAEVQLDARATDPWTANVSPSTLSLQPDEAAQIHVDAEATGAAGQAPELTVEASYASAGTDVTSTFELAGNAPTGSQDDAGGGPEGNGSADPATEDTDDTPLTPAAALVALSLAAAVGVRRRS